MRIVTERTRERGRRVRMARVGAGLTQEELARACRVNRDTIYRAETGQRDLELGLLVLIAEVTGQPLSWLTAEPSLAGDRVIPGYLKDFDVVGLVDLDFAA